MQVCLCASSDRESGFRTCGGHVKLVQACLYGENTLQRRFNRRGGAVKHVQACLSARKGCESSFHHWRSCEGRVSLFIFVKDPTKPFLPPRRCFDACASPFMCQF